MFSGCKRCWFDYFLQSDPSPGTLWIFSSLKPFLRLVPTSWVLSRNYSDFLSRVHPLVSHPRRLHFHLSVTTSQVNKSASISVLYGRTTQPQTLYSHNATFTNPALYTPQFRGQYRTIWGRALGNSGHVPYQSISKERASEAFQYHCLFWGLPIGELSAIVGRREETWN